MKIITKKKRGDVIFTPNGFTYQLDSLTPDIISDLLQSPVGVYGIEAIKENNEYHTYAFTPSVGRLKREEVLHDWQCLCNRIDQSVLYEIKLKSHSFLPLYSEKAIDLLRVLEELQIDTGILFNQILFSRAIGNWRNEMITKYEEYQDGNEYPSGNHLIRLVQSKILSVFEKAGNFNFKKEPIPAAEEKILSANYHFEMRFMLQDEEHYINSFERSIGEALKQANYFNEIQLVRVNDKERLMDYILARKLHPRLREQLLTVKEITSLICNSQTITISSSQKPLIDQTSNKQLSSPLIMLPCNSTRDNKTDDAVIKQLTDSFKRIKISNKPIKVQSVQRGATLQKVTITIPSDTVYTHIDKNLKNIQATLGNDAISVEIGELPNTADFSIPCEERAVVYLRDILDSPEFNDAEKYHLPLVIGEDSIGNPIVHDLTELKHILIAGATGAGKSVYLNALILTMLMHKNPSELKMILIDPKKVELNHFASLPHVTFVNEMKKAASVFQTLIAEMEKRYDLLAEKGYRSLVQYNQKEKEKMPFIVCVVDELSDLMDTHGRLVEDAIIRLGQKARAAGIHLVLCTQKPSADVITTRIKSNLPSAISFRLKAQSDYRTVFGKGIPYHLLGNGDGVAMIEGSNKEFIRFQAPAISLDIDQEIKIYKSLEKLYSESDKVEIELVEKEEPIDKIKRIIADTGETRVGELQKLMQIRINIVSDLMKQLVHEGWLVKEGKAYQLVVSEEELSKWRSC